MHATLQMAAMHRRAQKTPPPTVLMEHGPLASFANGVLSTFNELRHCAPVTLAPTIASIVQVCIIRVVQCPAEHGLAFFAHWGA